MTPKLDNDGKKKYEWKSRYIDKHAKWQMFAEGTYLFVLLLVSFFLFFLNYNGKFTNDLFLASTIYMIAGGLQGGTIFSIKFFYHIVAKGYWSQDRLAWRLLSPFVAITISFVVGMLVHAGTIQSVGDTSKISSYVALGFLSGYFADDAARKMKDIALAMFGNDVKNNGKDSEGNGKTKENKDKELDVAK